MAEEEDKPEKFDPRNPDVVTKYRKAGEIVQGALQAVVSLAKPGARIVTLCETGDNFVLEATSKIYNKGKVEKGIGFPTCVSVNNIVGHFSPLGGDDSVLAEGDVVKVDLGCHVDGYVAMAAHSFIVGPQGPVREGVTGSQANVLLAAITASQAAFKLLKAGNKNNQITEIIQKVASSYGVRPVQGVLSHQMSRFVLDGEKVIINRFEPEQKIDEITFEPNEVYAIDIVMSTGEGKPKEFESRTTIYKRAADEVYNLKMKASRAVFAEINKRFPTFPFSMRYFDETKARFGIKECFSHNLLHAYPVLQEKEGEIVAHIKFTAIILPTGTIKLCGGDWDASAYKTDLSITDESVKSALASSSAKKKNKKKKKKAGDKAPAGDGKGEKEEEEEDEE